MKTFCIIEQGKTVNHPLTLKKKELFTTEFSDFYRLNWKTEADPNAFLKIKNITWSEGRSLLYEHVPRDYEYYVMIDEDISFHAEKESDIPLRLKLFFDKYNPLTGTLLNEKVWNFNYHMIKNITGGKRLYYKFMKDVILKSKHVHPFCCQDLDLQFFSKSFANIIFPVIYHGSWRSMHYVNWICYKTFPLKQMCFRGISITNHVHEEHEDIPQSMDEKHCRVIMRRFNANAYDKSFDPDGEWELHNLIKINYKMALKRADKRPVQFTMADLAKVYDINNNNFLKRSSTITK